jgi:hypothetical protein
MALGTQDAEFQRVASLIQAIGHDVHTPTIKGNRPSDSKTGGLSEAIESIVGYLEETGSGRAADGPR